MHAINILNRNKRSTLSPRQFHLECTYDSYRNCYFKYFSNLNYSSLQNNSRHLNYGI